MNIFILRRYIKITLINYFVTKNSTYFNQEWWGDEISGKDLNSVNENFQINFESKIFYERDIKFIVTDLKNEIIVSYSGTVPALFAEGKGVVAEGNLKDKKFFIAKRILAKHDENYMPPEVKQSLNKDAK